MAKKYFWQRISDPDSVVAAAQRPVQDERVRYSTMIQRAGLFKDEPQVVHGLMDKNVPLALAMRAFDGYYATKQKSIDNSLNGAGFTATREKTVANSPTDEDKVAAAQKAMADFKANPNGGGLLGWLGDRADDAVHAIGDAGKAIAEGATWAYNHTVGDATAAGGASDYNDSGDGGDGSVGLFDVAHAVSEDPKLHPHIPVVSELTGALGGAVEGGANTFEGAYRLYSGNTSNAQRKDIRSAGLNPDRLGDRINFYAQDFGEARGPVNDDDVRWLKGTGRWSPTDVDAAREIVTSGAMEDLSRSMPALSPQAQDLVMRSSRDQESKDLLTAMSDQTQNSIGGRIVRHALPNAEPGEAFGPGSMSRGVAAAVSEIVATWHVDPAVLALKGAGAMRAARFGVAGLPAEKIDKTIQVLKASDDSYKPSGALAKRFDQAMQTADDIVTKGVSTPEAAAARQSWLRRYPGYDKTLDLLIGQRAGSVGPIRARTLEEAKGEVSSAAKKGRSINSWALDATSDGKPLWRYTAADGTKLSDEARAVQRAKAAEELSTFIVMDAYASGREITGSRLLLPGQLSLNGKVRDTIAPVLEAFGRRDQSVVKQLKAVGKKPIDLNGHVLADEQGRWDQLVSPDAAEWLRNNYTFGITHTFSRGWRNFERTFSNKTIMPTSPDSTKVYGQLVSQFMPKRQAQMVTTQYAAANPAERWVMTRQTIGSLLNVMNLRNTPESQKIVDQLTKGLVPEGEYINGYKAGAREFYTTPDGNNIRVGDLKMPAAVHPWQLSEGFDLPNWRELRGLANRGAILNAVTRTANGQAANSLVRAWKSSKVTTWSNMARQGLESWMFTAWRDPAVFAQYRTARKAVKADTLNRKVNDHDLERLANHVNNLTPENLAELEQVRRTKPETYVSTVSAMLQRDGFNPGAAEVMARLGQDVDLSEFGKTLASGTERRVRHLAMMGPVDKLRRVRAARAEAKGGNVEDTPMSKHLDGEMVQQMLEGTAKQFGSAAESYAWNMAERSTHMDRQRITDAAGRNVSFRPVKIVNGYKWGDTTPLLWAAELGRRQSDPIGNLAMRLIARQHLERAAEKARPKAAVDAAVDTNAAAIDKLVADLGEGLPVDPARLADADELITHLYGQHELGAGMRSNAAVMQYLPDGTAALNPADRMAAAQNAARRAVDDLAHHMGGKVDRGEDGVRVSFPDESTPLLEKLAAGEEVSAADLAKLDDAAKPEGMVAPIYAPMIPEKQGFASGLSNLATRAYGAVVADPLDKLFIMPTFVANRRIAQDELTPLMEALTAKGMSPGQAAFMVEDTINKRAVARTFNGTDQPQEKSVFSEMADKWLMFQRAQEDFLRRLVHASTASPEGLVRANLLTQAGVHAGIMHYEPYQDEEGNTDHHLTFTYPGTAVAQRVMADALVGLGLEPEEVLRVPQFDGLKSQVQFLNPSLANPLQFSANPIFGFATWGAEKLWPSATVDLERLRRGLNGGQDFEGTSGPFEWKNIVPSMFSRLTTFATMDDADGQFQSAMRSALMYAELSGQAPGPAASPAERARYLDAVKATTTNIMIQRAIFGSFAPASPQIEDPNLGELDVAAKMSHLPNLRSEFFDIRNDLAKKYPDNFYRADSEAVAEFARRYPGELIVNPSAFSTGSTKVAGASKGYAPYTIEATRWLFDNLEFVKSNPTVALALMPKDTANGDFSNEAYKLQLKSDIRTHKSITEFYDDLTLSNDIDEYYKTRSRYFAAAKGSPGLSKTVYAKMDDWEDGWRRSHPLASAELNNRANPDYVHGEIAPAVGRIADGTDPLPASLKSLVPAIKEMWQDYQKYRSAYMRVGYYDNTGRSDLNKQYQQQGDIKWLGGSQTGLDIEQRNKLNASAGSLSGLWDLMRVTEGR